MGLFSSANTWRAPLQLIDCWLPEPSPRAEPAVRAVRNPSTAAVLTRFSRAGWLGRAAANGARIGATPAPTRTLRACTRPARHDGRVVLSGRMDEVCAALERLAASEEAATARPSA